MTAASTTTLPPSDSSLREQLDDAAKHIGQQRERIKALEAEVAAHSSKTMTMVANHAALTDRLRDALRPFARMDHVDRHYKTDGELLVTVHLGGRKAAKHELCLSDFRRALSVLSGEAK